jgi:hypothetical protein
VSVSDATPIDATAAVALLIANYEPCAQGVPGFVHLPAPLLPSLTSHGVVRRVGNRVVTDTGYVVVPGPGYPASTGTWGPITDDDPSGMEAPEGAAWVFISGPVEVAGPHYTRDPVTAARWAHRENRFLTQPEAWWVYRFDPCCTFAALAKLPTND